ncbi:MAG: lipopolysaccharide biosynthesis protein [Prevotella sp.]|nr:lipopolysaccharide biosynthesis protein [Prevotella sp.]
MNLQKTRYTYFGGVRKNMHLPYYVHGIWMMMKPRCLTEWRRESLLRQFDRLSASEQQYVQQRVDYYNRLSAVTPLPAEAPAIGEQSFLKKRFLQKKCPSVYIFDSYEWNRYFPARLRWMLEPGDVSYTLPVPTITKSRPIEACKSDPNSVLINMDKVRHFMFFHDPIPFDRKRGQVIFRGVVSGKPNRTAFFEKYFGNPLFDMYDTSRHSALSEEMRQHGETTIFDHLSYKYIMSLEGNDVASNLKWVMNSNCIAVAPPMNYETWFMEGRLKGGEHFIEIAPDYSNLEERIAYYNDHPNEAKDIIENANQYCKQFFNKERERLIALMVMEKYFRMTGQEV